MYDNYCLFDTLIISIIKYNYTIYLHKPLHLILNIATI